MTIHFTSEPMKIGQHEWRVVVYSPHGAPGERYTRYEFRGPKAPGWGGPDTWFNAAQDWPGINSERALSSSDGGMPKSLRTLYRRNLVAIQSALGHGNADEQTTNADRF